MKTLILKITLMGIVGLLLSACGNSGSSNNNNNCLNSAYQTGYQPGYQTGYQTGYNVNGINNTGICNSALGLNGLATSGQTVQCTGQCQDVNPQSPYYGQTAICSPQMRNCSGHTVICPQVYGNVAVMCL